MKDFLQRLVINILAVLVSCYLVERILGGGIRYEKPMDLIAASLVLGILNSLLRPLLMLLSLPLVIVTLGLFTLVINALLLWLTGELLKPHFEVTGFWPAFWGALIISIVSIILNTLTGTGNSRIKVVKAKSGRGGDDDKVIDI